MANKQNDDIKYVGDSRIKAKRTPNIPKDYSEFPGKTEAFWPNFLLKEWMVGAVVLIGFLILTVSEEPPLQTVADPTDTGYFPVPDWYFLFLFQLLKFTYASGPYKLIGTVIIPGLAFGALLLAPWLDRSRERRAFRRPVATGLMLLAIASIFYLTLIAYEAHDWSQEERYSAKNMVEAVEIDTSDPAYELFMENSCFSCHGDQLEGQGAAGPPLSVVGDHLDADGIRDVIVNGRGTMPPGMFSGTDEELDALVEWLANLKAEE